MFAKPEPEHKLFDHLVGDWISDGECQIGPDAPIDRMQSKLSYRSMGGLWILGEGSGDTPEGDSWSTQMLLGYDPVSKHYVGTFVGSMMTHLWVYRGTYDAATKKLVLDAEGPRMDDKPGLAKYQDTLEFVDNDHHILSSHMLGDDGQWRGFMKAHHRRKK